MFREIRNRRQFHGLESPITPFKKDIKRADFAFVRLETESMEAEQDENNELVMQHNLKPIDMYWLWKLMNEHDVPLHAGFISHFVEDLSPLQRICYMDPIHSSPTRNDVVKETIIRTINGAQEAGQEYAVVTYDLAVASQAYSIQALEAPLFDKLLVLLGNFYIELDFFGAEEHTSVNQELSLF